MPPDSLTARAAALLAERKAALNRCPVGRYRGTLPAADLPELDALLADPDMPAAIIAEVLDGALDQRAIASHRRGVRGQPGCKCPS